MRPSRFVDTSFFAAMQLRDDDNYRTAVTLWQERKANRELVVTTNVVVGETWTFLRRKLGFKPAAKFARAIRKSPAVTIHQIDSRIDDEAWKWLLKHDEREYSYVDATSFATMRRFEISEALAFDGDFSAAGFVEVRE